QTCALPILMRYELTDVGPDQRMTRSGDLFPLLQRASRCDRVRMTPEHDRTIVARIASQPLATTDSYSHTDVAALLREWARGNAPRRFALYRTVRDDAGYDGDVFAWGLAHEDHLTVRSLDERLHGRYVSTQSMLRHLSRDDADIDLVWID